MSKLIITTCDVCNPGQSEHNGGRGVCCWPPTQAVKDFGWLRKRDGSGIERHICRNCQDAGIVELPTE